MDVDKKSAKFQLNRSIFSCWPFWPPSWILLQKKRQVSAQTENCFNLNFRSWSFISIRTCSKSDRRNVHLFLTSRFRNPSWVFYWFLFVICFYKLAKLSIFNILPALSLPKQLGHSWTCIQVGCFLDYRSFLYSLIVRVVLSERLSMSTSRWWSTRCLWWSRLLLLVFPSKLIDDHVDLGARKNVVYYVGDHFPLELVQSGAYFRQSQRFDAFLLA